MYFLISAVFFQTNILCHEENVPLKSEIRWSKLNKIYPALGDFLCIPTPNTGQLNPLFHTFAEFRLIVNRIVVWQSTDWLAAIAQFSPNG